MILASNRKVVAAVMFAAILPGVSAASAAYAFPILAQTQFPAPGQQIVDQLASKSIAYWFLTLAVFSIGSWSFIVKWLIAQLESQRQAHAQVTQQLIDYMKTDHAALASLTANALDVMKEVSSMLGQVKAKLDTNK